MEEERDAAAATAPYAVEQKVGGEERGAGDEGNRAPTPYLVEARANPE